MTELHRHLGEYTDVPRGHRRRLPGDRVPVRPVPAPGQPARVRGAHRQGPGLGRVPGAHRGHRVRAGLLHRGDAARARASFDGARVVVSGSGNVAIYAIEKAQQLGATVVGFSDSSGCVHTPDGVDVDLLRRVKEQRRERVSAYAEEVSGARFSRAGTCGSWSATSPCRAPPRTSSTGRRRVCWPRTGAASSRRARTCPPRRRHRGVPGGGDRLRPGEGLECGRGGDVGPGDAAERDPGYVGFEYTDQRLRQIMTNIFTACEQTAEEYGSPGIRDGGEHRRFPEGRGRDAGAGRDLTGRRARWAMRRPPRCDGCRGPYRREGGASPGSQQVLVAPPFAWVPT
ncbi:NADP-specific glutamate dehydrogenase [Rothia kristinae]|nr:NADP-specific glutamate dehydrogenase [Rothia kristinae]